MILFLGQLLGVFQLGIVVRHFFKVKTEISTKNEKMCFAQKRGLQNMKDLVVYWKSFILGEVESFLNTLWGCPAQR